MLTQMPQDQYIKVGQIDTRFWALGDKGTAVILIHGIEASVEAWMYNIDALAQHHRVYAIDLVGFGRSDKPPIQLSFPYFAQFVSDFMEAQHIDRAILVGNSLGGGVALQVAIRFPAKVEKLVLSASAGLGKEIALFLRLPTLPLLGEFLTRPSRKLTAHTIKQCVYDPALVTDDLVELSYQLAALPGAQKSFLSALRASINFCGMQADVLRSFADNLATIAVPTLVVWGQQDRILPLAQAHVAAKAIPSTTLRLFDSCGHLPQFEHAEEFNALVLEFLAG